MIDPTWGRLSGCCTSEAQPGCRPSNVGRCAGCGPETGIPCCDRSGRGCTEGQTCVGDGDEAACIPCGEANGPCCRRNDERRCDGDLTCFDRPGQTPTGDVCLRCGSAKERCCPDGSCAPGHACADGRCLPCGGRGQACCDGRQCSGEYDRCEGPGRGVCAQRCGAVGQPCCGERGGAGYIGGLCFGDNVSCAPRTFTCYSCGRNGQPACSREPICDQGLGRVPVSGICRPCGGQGQPCCAASSPLPCHAGFTCNHVGLCVPCGQADQPCCATGPPCVEGTSCEDGFCQRPIG